MHAIVVVACFLYVHLVRVSLVGILIHIHGSHTLPLAADALLALHKHRVSKLAARVLPRQYTH